MNLSLVRVTVCAFAMFFLVIVVNAQNPPAPVPRFEKDECAIKVPNNITFECGNLFVKENRAKKNSRSIKLPVIVVKSTAENPDDDPVVYTGGGPGGSSLGRARGARHLAPITAKRDFIIFEQRGTRYAGPSMQCPEVDQALQSAARDDLSWDAGELRELEAVRVCKARLIAEGFDLSAYDSAASAADLEDLRNALGIGKWNLYGISYSTRLMLNYIRVFGENVRSVVLDSVLPPEVNWDETSVDGVIDALDVMFQNCKADSVCNTKYPKLKKRFYKFLSEAQEKPLIVRPEVDGKKVTLKIDGSEVFEYVYVMMENTGALRRIPSILDAITKGDHTSLQGYAREKLTQTGFVWGMRYSVWCREEMPFQSSKKIQSQIRKYQAIKGFRIQGAFPEICKVWNVPSSDSVENEPVFGKIPMLVFGGEYDPDTPPKWGRQVADRFRNSYFYEVKGVSHGVLFWNKCAIANMYPEFLDDPTKKPDSSCLPKYPGIEFK